MPRRSGRGWWRDASELLGSMRFAIALLGIICIASVIGTVIKQAEPANNYVNQFGPFWAEVFDKAGLYAVYSAGWFLVILAFLVISTSLCIIRNTPKILADWRTFKERMRASALDSFHHKDSGRFEGLAPAAALTHVQSVLAKDGWSVKLDARPDGQMVAARRGMAHKIGYLAAHSAIVLICLGGLSDGDLVVRAQMLLRGVTPASGNARFSEMGPQHRLPDSNPTFRGNLAVAEGEKAGLAVLSMPQGIVLQALPFDVELKRFIVEYYDTGMPRLFASDIVIHDRVDGSNRTARVEVNKPVTHRGVTIYQSSFDDGGSKVLLKAWPLTGPASAPTTIAGVIGDRLRGGEGQPSLELVALRTINVENLGGAKTEGATDVRAVDLMGGIDRHLGSGAKGSGDKHLRNVGPSITYRLRDASGQAREFHAYMRPMDLDGQRVLLTGVRERPEQAFQYLRIPADEKDGVEGWWRVWRALHDPALREQAVERYVVLSTPGGAQAQPEAAQALRATASRALAMFAGAMPAKVAVAASAPAAPAGASAPSAGLLALSQFVEGSVPQPERERMAEVLMRIVGGSIYELVNLTREKAGQPPLPPNETTQRQMSAMMMALSDAAFYPSDVMLELDRFDQVQASVFQVARAPGKVLVYLGAVLLMIGVFAMLYIREKRLWIWLQPDGDGTRWRGALSSTRRTLDVDASFTQLMQTLRQTTARSPG